MRQYTVESPEDLFDKNTEPANSCKWYGDKQNYYTMHLWGEVVHVRDSAFGKDWLFQKCVLCGTPDIDFLKRQL